MATLTLGLLAERGACSGQREEFERVFGREPVEVTPELCEKHADLFDWDWAKRNLLTRDNLREFIRRTDEARREYDKKSVEIHADADGSRCTTECPALTSEWFKLQARMFGELFTGEMPDPLKCWCGESHANN